MDAKTLRRLERIEKRAERLNARIIRLAAKLDHLQRSDPEYADYVDVYLSLYSDEPLSIRVYYERKAELSQLNALLMKCPPEEYAALWEAHKARLQYLERVLAV